MSKSAWRWRAGSAPASGSSDFRPKQGRGWRNGMNGCGGKDRTKLFVSSETLLSYNKDMKSSISFREVKEMKGRIYDKLCAIDDTGRASALSAEATVFCGQCGAKAYDQGSVCEPIALSERK